MKTHLRQHCKARSTQIAPSLRHQLSLQIARRLFQEPYFHSAEHVALYHPKSHEVDTDPIQKKLFQAHKSCYLPQIQAHRRLLFGLITPDTPLYSNRYAILEPDTQENIAPEKLDLVIVPLVAFDNTLCRLGMGGGYYDTTFAFRRAGTKPYLVGLAFECQKVAEVPRSVTDLLLDVVITETLLYRKSHPSSLLS